MRTKHKILPADEENIHFESELLHAVHNQMAEIFSRDRL